MEFHIKRSVSSHFEQNRGLTDPSLADDVKSKGYDILLIDKGLSTEEYVVLNPNSIIITGEIIVG